VLRGRVTRRVLVPFREPGRIQPYLDAVVMAGLEPVPFLTETPRSLADVEGLVLTGGTDIEPVRYREFALPETEEPDRERDEIEFELLAEALQRDLPVLAICRGFQLMNVHQGGTLRQHIESGRHRVLTEDKGEAVHEIEVEPGSRLAAILGATRVGVNSRHHQSVERVGANLWVVGRSVEDGVVEAFELPVKRFVIGVQWHPENQIRRNPEQLRLFEAFAEAVG
jgi:putative glutamine amidotransferase